MVVDNKHNTQVINPVVSATTWQFPSFGHGTPSASSQIAPQRSNKSESRKADKIRRPMNAFMVWSQMRRQEISMQNQHRLHNSEISKQLGVEWKTLTDAQKKPFQEKARELRDDLMRAHPDYVYRPNRRGRRSSACAKLDLPNTAVATKRESPPSLPPLSTNQAPTMLDMQTMIANLARAATVPALQLPYPSHPPQLQDPRLLFSLNPYLLPFWFESANRAAAAANLQS